MKPIPSAIGLAHATRVAGVTALGKGRVVAALGAQQAVPADPASPRAPASKKSASDFAAALASAKKGGARNKVDVSRDRAGEEAALMRGAHVASMQTEAAMALSLPAQLARASRSAQVDFNAVRGSVGRGPDEPRTRGSLRAPSREGVPQAVPEPPLNERAAAPAFQAESATSAVRAPGFEVPRGARPASDAPKLTAMLEDAQPAHAKAVELATPTSAAPPRVRSESQVAAQQKWSEASPSVVSPAMLESELSNESASQTAAPVSRDGIASTGDPRRVDAPSLSDPRTRQQHSGDSQHESPRAGRHAASESADGASFGHQLATHDARGSSHVSESIASSHAARADRLAEAVAARVPEAPTRFTVTVTPESLGPVDVQLVVRGQGVELSMLAASAEAREALTNGMDELRAALADRGLQLTGADVGARSDSGQHPPRPRHADDEPSSAPAKKATAPTGASSPTPGAPRTHVGDGRVDLHA